MTIKSVRVVKVNFYGRQLVKISITGADAELHVSLNEFCDSHKYAQDRFVRIISGRFAGRLIGVFTAGSTLIDPVEAWLRDKLDQQSTIIHSGPVRLALRPVGYVPPIISDAGALPSMILHSTGGL